ncbi:unnamed protein product [Urochloa humidicola]
MISDITGGGAAVLLDDATAANEGRGVVSLVVDSSPPVEGDGMASRSIHA